MAAQITIMCPCCGTRIVVVHESAPRRAHDPDDAIERIHAHPDDDAEEWRGYHRPARRFVDPHDPDGGDDDVRCPNRGRLIRGH